MDWDIIFRCAERTHFFSNILNNTFQALSTWQNSCNANRLATLYSNIQWVVCRHPTRNRLIKYLILFCVATQKPIIHLDCKQKPKKNVSFNSYTYRNPPPSTIAKPLITLICNALRWFDGFLHLYAYRYNIIDSFLAFSICIFLRLIYFFFRPHFHQLS